MALYADLGAQVTLVTCTRGEEGEVLVPALAHLASGVDDGLGKHREVELANAMQALGITDFRFLGAPDKSFRDSGMMDTEPNKRPDVFPIFKERLAKLYLDALKQDPVADVRSNVAALKTKIERVESSNVSPTSVQKPAG